MQMLQVYTGSQWVVFVFVARFSFNAHLLYVALAVALPLTQDIAAPCLSLRLSYHSSGFFTPN